MEPQTFEPSKRPSFTRAFIPLWVALGLALVVLAMDYHRRNAPLTRLAVQVTVEGKNPEAPVSVLVNGRDQPLLLPVPLGSSTITISAPECEAQTQSRFVWYGVTDLGSVDLALSRGTVAASVSPTPESYELTGDRGKWTNTTGSFSGVPVGRYVLVARYGAANPVESRTVTVDRQRTTSVAFTAPFGALDLSSDPVEGEFGLISEPDGGLRTGRFPTNYARIPAGKYRLIARRPGYERELRVEVGRNETNRLVVKFVYGAAEITTSPAGATILIAGNERGIAPLNLNQLVPGVYKIEARLQGYDVVSTELQVTDETPAKLNLVLVNTEYRQAMEAARSSLELKRYPEAIQQLEIAMVAQLGDREAGQLLGSTRLKWQREQAEVFAQRGEFDAALKVLGAAQAAAPGDTEIAALQKRLRTAKADSDQQQVLGRYRQSVADAKSAAAGHDYKKALALLADAKKLLPDQAETTALEAELRKDQAEWTSIAAKQKREAARAALEQEFKAAWQKALSEDRNHEAFTERSWTTTKSAAVVRAAFERMAKDNGLYKPILVSQSSSQVFTAKVGEIAQGFTLGRYLRVAVVTYEENDTRILVKMVDISAGQPEPDTNLRQRHIDQARAQLATLLGNDLK